VQRGSFDLNTASGLGAILLWSMTFAFARSLSEQVGPLTGGAAAYLIGGSLCLLRVAFLRAGSTRFLGASHRYLFGCGALFVFYTAAVYVAVGLAKNREQLLEIAMVNYLWPTLTVLGSLILLKKRAKLWLGPGIVLAMAGVFLVMAQGARISLGTVAEHFQSNPVAYALALAAAVSWALYSNLARLWSDPESSGAVEFFIPAAGFILLLLRFLTPEPGRWNLRAIGEAFALGVVTALSYFLWDTSMRKGNLALVIACSYFTPLLSTLVSCIYLGVSPGPRFWLGSVLLVTGSAIAWRSVSEPPSATAAEVPIGDHSFKRRDSEVE